MKTSHTAIIIAVAGVIVIAASAWTLLAVSRYQGGERTDFMDQVHARLAAEKARQAALTPEQKAAEAKAAAAAEAQRKAIAEAQARAQMLDDARGACLLFVQRALNDPYSAKFDPTSSWPAGFTDNGQVLVHARGRAKNAFGAYVYSTWKCRVQRSGGDWTIIELATV